MDVVMQQSTRVRVQIWPLDGICEIVVFVDEIMATRGTGSTIGNALLNAGLHMTGIDTAAVLRMTSAILEAQAAERERA